MSVIERCLSSDRESNKESKEKQGPILGVPEFYRGVRLIEVSVKRELTV